MERQRQHFRYTFRGANISLDESEKAQKVDVTQHSRCSFRDANNSRHANGHNTLKLDGRKARQDAPRHFCFIVSAVIVHLTAARGLLQKTSRLIRTMLLVMRMPLALPPRLATAHKVDPTARVVRWVALRREIPINQFQLHAIASAPAFAILCLSVPAEDRPSRRAPTTACASTRK